MLAAYDESIVLCSGVRGNELKSPILDVYTYNRDEKSIGPWDHWSQKKI